MTEFSTWQKGYDAPASVDYLLKLDEPFWASADDVGRSGMHMGIWERSLMIFAYQNAGKVRCLVEVLPSQPGTVALRIDSLLDSPFATDEDHAKVLKSMNSVGWGWLVGGELIQTKRYLFDIKTDVGCDALTDCLGYIFGPLCFVYLAQDVKRLVLYRDELQRRQLLLGRKAQSV